MRTKGHDSYVNKEDLRLTYGSNLLRLLERFPKYQTKELPELLRTRAWEACVLTNPRFDLIEAHVAL